MLLFVRLLTPLLALLALMEATLPLAPRGAHLAPVVLRKPLLEQLVKSVLLVPSVHLSVLDLAQLALLVNINL